MKKILLAASCLLLSLGACAGQSSKTAEDSAAVAESENALPKVYFIKDITPEALLKVYHALGVTPSGKVAVKISTGESSQSNQLSPELIKDLVSEVKGTLVECNTAYGGNRSTTENHLKAIKERGYDKIAAVDIMDSEGSIDIPVQDTTWIKHNKVGAHLANYDYLVNLAHFKGHAMGGFGGVLKNQSIGIASSDGKAYIHTAGAHDTMKEAFNNPHGQDAFIESMAVAAQSVHDYFKGNVLYIDVMNNLSVDCDCDGHPHDPEMKDIGILASLDPVALDQACLDLVFNYDSKDGDNAAALQERINSRHGTHIIDYAVKLGLGSKEYDLITID